MSLARRATAEAVGTAMLLATVVGSGIMGERLAGGNVAVALLANTLATGAGIVALILTSGAHFNPAVTLADASQGGMSWREVPECIHWSFDDPVAATGEEAAKLAVFRRVRNEIRARRLQECPKGAATGAAVFPALPRRRRGAVLLPSRMAYLLRGPECSPNAPSNQSGPPPALAIAEIKGHAPVVESIA